MNWFEALVLGLLQGLTEFLPVSSSGHLEIAKALFGIDPETSFYFTVAMHGATVLSTTGAFIILIGFITAFVSGYIACRWMIGLVKRSKLIWFAIYCTAAGLLSVILG